MEYQFAAPTNEWSFETFCMRLFRSHWPDSDPQLYGRRGQRQDGVDIIDESGIEPLRAGQCKWKKVGQLLAVDEILDEIAKAKNFTPKIGHYFIVTTSERSTDVQRSVVELNQQHRKQGLFLITVLTWDRVEEILREKAELWPMCMDPPVKQAIDPLRQDVAALSQRMDVLIPATVDDEYDAKLESARQRIDDHDWQAAKVILRQLKANFWSELSGRQKSLTDTWLAQAAFAMGKMEEAGQLYREAKQHQPDEERAKVNEAMGIELLGLRDEAHQVARRLASEFPQAIRPWAIICRTAPDEVTTADLMEQVPGHAMGNDEVLVAIAMRALKDRNWEEAETLARRASENGDKDWAAPWLLLAQAKINKAVSVGLKHVKGPVVINNPSVFREAISLFDRAVECAERSRNDYLYVESLTERGRAKDLAGDPQGASDDFARAHNHRPDDAEVAARYGQHLFLNDRVDAAIPLLRDAANLGAGGDAAFTLALALRSQNEEANRSEWQGLVTRAALSGRWDAADFAVDVFIDNDDMPAAEDLIARLATSGFSPAAMNCFRARILIALEQHAEAVKLVKTAHGSLRDESDIRLVRLVAETYCRSGNHGDALELWERVATETRQIPDVWKLVDTARRVKHYDVVRRVCREWRHAGIIDSKLLDEELGVLERFAPSEALDILRSEVEANPDDSYLKLRLSRLALTLDRPEFVCRDVAKFPASKDVGPRNGTVAVQVLLAIEEFEAALKYAYELLRYNQDEPIANMTLACVVMAARMPGDVIPSAKEVGVGAAVCFVENGTDDLQWRVIEDHADEPSFSDGIPSNHGLAKRLVGLKTGDKFVLAGEEADGRKAEVKEVVSHFVYRARKSMNEWQVRFPDEPGIEMFRMSTRKDADDTELPDFTPVIRRTHERKRYVQQVFKTYRESPASIHLAANAVGTHYVDTLIHLAQSEENGIRCCESGVSAFEEAAEFATTASIVVLDLSSIATLTLLGLEDRLGDFPTPLVVSAGTMLELRALRESRRELEKSNGWIVPTEGGIGIRMIESTEEERRKDRERIEKLVEVVAKNANAQDCGELADQLPDEREQMIGLLGQHGSESALLGRRPGHVLWTDDFAVAAYGQQRFGVRRVWTQAVLASLGARGLITNEEYREASARLLGYDFSSIRFDAHILLAAASLAKWLPSAWPLKQALTPIGSNGDPRTMLVIAGHFLREIISQPLELPGHEVVALAVFDKIAAGPLGLEGIEILRRNLLKIFGLNVAAAQQINHYVDRWLKSRS